MVMTGHRVTGGRATVLVFGPPAFLQREECNGQQGKERQAAPEIHKRVKPRL